MCDERCERCGHVFDEGDYQREYMVIHVATYGKTSEPFDLGTGETLPAGSFYHGDAWHHLCPECSAAWRAWFSLFLNIGETQY